MNIVSSRMKYFCGVENKALVAKRKCAKLGMRRKAFVLGEGLMNATDHPSQACGSLGGGVSKSRWVRIWW